MIANHRKRTFSATAVFEERELFSTYDSGAFRDIELSATCAEIDELKPINWDNDSILIIDPSQELSQDSTLDLLESSPLLRNSQKHLF